MKKICIKKVWIEPGCITCGLCEFTAPEVFEVTDISRVKKDIEVEKYSENILDAAQGCPVNVIQYVKKEDIDNKKDEGCK